MSFKIFLSDSGISESYDPRTDGVKFYNTPGKAFFLLYEDLDDCLQKIWENLPEISQQLENNWEYEERRFRKAFKDNLNGVQDNTVTAQLGSQTINTVKILGLYSAYLAGVNNCTESFDQGKYLNPEWVEKAGFERNDWVTFIGWLKRYPRNENGGRYSSKSVKSYYGAVETYLSKIAGVDLLKITSVFDLPEYENKIEVNPDYIEQNSTGNGMYSRAFDLFKEYLMSKPFMPAFLLIKVWNSLFKALVISALSKPFTILTGASGTGKTKLAEKIAAYLAAGDNSCLVAVGADWTDNRSVVGFVNHLRPLEIEDRTMPVYQSTPVLDLILRANNAVDIPHFLILDEMNLSHVERYFSDFLSAMEQSEGRLKLHSEKEALPRYQGDEEKVPSEIPYPENLFVIGTVNVDETTYMFSPKVLDRANVIEFTVDKGELQEFLKDPKPYPETEPAGGNAPQAFLNLALRARKSELDALDFDKVITPLEERVIKIFEIMQAGRFEFAFRSSNELIRYLQVSRELSPDKNGWDDGGWKKDLDTQILQKLLPRLHGSAGRIGGLLARLAQYCFDEAAPKEAPDFDFVLSLKPEDALFENSLKKLQAMIRTLQEEHFVSFIC